jgi:DNA-binding transcriptional LysR family regulator
MEVDEPDSIKELVKLGIGIAVLPMWSVGDDAKRGTLEIVHLPNRHFLNYGFLYRKAHHPQVLANFRAVALRWTDWWPLAPYVSPPLGPGDRGAA